MHPQVWKEDSRVHCFLLITERKKRLPVDFLLTYTQYLVAGSSRRLTRTIARKLRTSRYTSGIKEYAEITRTGSAGQKRTEMSSRPLTWRRMPRAKVDTVTCEIWKKHLNTIYAEFRLILRKCLLPFSSECFTLMSPIEQSKSCTGSF